MLTTRKSKIVSALVVLSIIIGLVLIYAISEYNRKPEGLASAEVDFEIDASALIGEFENDSEASHKKYENKVILVTGPVKGFDGKGENSIISLGTSSSLSSIICNTENSQDMSQVETGQKISLKGMYTGYNHDDLLGTDVILSRCLIINNQE